MHETDSSLRKCKLVLILLKITWISKSGQRHCIQIQQLPHMSIWYSNAYEEKELKIFWQLLSERKKMRTSTMVSKASWEFLITAIVFSQHLENILLPF